MIDDLYKVYIPAAPSKDQILFSDLKKSHQFWRRTPLPKFYDERRGEEMYRQEKEMELVNEGVIKRVKYFDPVLESYRRQEWYRRIYGVHIMINGEVVYLTGDHYSYLQWCKLDHQENEGYPLFYRPQLKRFYFSQLCLEDPFCFGYLKVGPRGGGKSSEEVALQLLNITKPPHRRYAAIQSKTEDDARNVVFQEKMVPMFNSWPDFFKPVYSHGSAPVERMVFKRPSVRSKESKMVKHGDEYELGNTILCYPPKNKALDGKTLADVINDEIGKLKPEKDVDAYTRNSVNVRTVFRNNLKRGIIRATTTVEEMDQGGDECLEIWNESDPRTRDQNGYTTSKLYKLFISALETQTQLADRYGNIPEDKARAIIMNEREPVKGDPYKLSLVMRKNPITEQEAFIKDQSKSTFDAMILTTRLSNLELNKSKFGVRVIPEWVNGKVDGDVVMVPHPDGPLTIYYWPDEWWSKDRKLLNACTWEPGMVAGETKPLWLPVNNDLFRSGCDPIRFVITSDSRASKAAGHGMLKYIPDLDNGKDLADWISNNIMWEYHHRDTDPTVDYENFIKIIRYFGHSIMPEANAGEFIKHLYGRGYQKFVIIRKNFRPDVLLNKHSKNAMSGENAVNSGKEVIESYVGRISSFVKRHGHRIQSIPLLKQLLSFTPANATTHDLVVSFGYSILAMEADLDDYWNESSQKQADIVSALFERYDISGSRSRAIASSSSVVADDDNENDFDEPGYLEHLLRG